VERRGWVARPAGRRWPAGHDVTCLARGDSGEVADGARLVVADSLAWERELGLNRERLAGLSPARERELLTAWESERAHADQHSSR
jgi:hypothetical protein